MKLNKDQNKRVATDIRNIADLVGIAETSEIVRKLMSVAMTLDFDQVRSEVWKHGNSITITVSQDKVLDFHKGKE